MKLYKQKYTEGILWVSEKKSIRDFDEGDFLWNGTFPKGFMLYKLEFRENLGQPQEAHKVVAQTSLNLPNIPNIEIGEEDVDVEKWAMDELIKKWSHLYTFGYPTKPYPTNYENDLNCVMLGYYKAAKEKGTYTGEDMTEFSQYLIELPNILLENKTLKEHLKHWDEQKCKMPNEIEVETELSHAEFGSDKRYNIKPVTYTKDNKLYLKIK